MADQKQPEPAIVKVDRTMADAMAVLAKKHERSMAGEVRYALGLYIEEHQHVIDAAGQR